MQKKKLAPLKHHKPALSKNRKSPDSALAEDSGLMLSMQESQAPETKKGKKKGKKQRDLLLTPLDDSFRVLASTKQGRRKSLGYGLLSPLARLSKGGELDRLRMKTGSADVTRIVSIHIEIELDALVQALSRRLRYQNEVRQHCEQSLLNDTIVQTGR